MTKTKGYQHVTPQMIPEEPETTTKGKLNCSRGKVGESKREGENQKKKREAKTWPLSNKTANLNVTKLLKRVRNVMDKSETLAVDRKVGGPSTGDPIWYSTGDRKASKYYNNRNSDVKHASREKKEKSNSTGPWREWEGTETWGSRRLRRGGFFPKKQTGRRGKGSKNFQMTEEKPGGKRKRINGQIIGQGEQVNLCLMSISLRIEQKRGAPPGMKTDMSCQSRRGQE